VACAQANVVQNGLAARIEVVHVTDDAVVAHLPLRPERVYDVVVCNPPFYASYDDMAERDRRKADAPSSVNQGTASEVITPGGEVAFVRRMMAESVGLRTRVRWFSTKLGIHASVTPLRAALAALHPPPLAVVTGVFRQGRTTRWGLAWSFTERCAAVTHTLVLPPGVGIDGLRQQLSDVYGMVCTSGDADDGSLVVEARANTWNRRARRHPTTAAPAAPARPLFRMAVAVAGTTATLSWRPHVVDNDDADDPNARTHFDQFVAVLARQLGAHAAHGP
jgi:hypothetical protein